MGKHNRERVGRSRADVQEVHRLPVDLGEELRVVVEPVLPAAPVELLPPGDHAPDPAERDAVGAILGPCWLLGRPPCAGQPAPQVVHVGVGNLGGEGLDHDASCGGTE